jgi:(4-O-methyl)-D-glucuronate---lignin esterase
MQTLERPSRPRTAFPAGSLPARRRLRVRSLAGLLVLAWAASTIGTAQDFHANYDESKAGSFTLPNPLIFNDGKPVETPRDWAKRRAEILALLEANVYGHSPAPPRQIRFKVFDLDRHALHDKAVRKQVSISFPTSHGDAHEDLLLYTPADSVRPVPVILALNFRGNQSVDGDPGVKLATIWAGKPPRPQPAPESSRGSDKNFEVEKVLARGYGFATVCYQDIEPDFDGGWKHGIRAKFLKPGQTELGPADWGAIGAWAYGLSRAFDYLEHDASVDAKRVAVMGHSRLGKTALWAGALDTRFALVISNCSGRGGAGLWRRNYGETLESMKRTFPYWFCRNLLPYAGRIDQLPVDSNELIALIAPRPVYINGAQDDQWADPHGMFLAAVAAGPVYKLLGAEGLGTKQMPPINQPIMHTIAYHIRDGKHAVTAFDWDQFLTFADMHLREH